MNILIKNTNNEPIYNQIYNQIKASIINGELSSGELLPSIRNLAKDLRISVITTKRAYEELERDGYINSVAGKGFYVAEKNMEMIKETNLKEIESYMKKINNLARLCHLSREDIIEMFKLISEEEL